MHSIIIIYLKKKREGAFLRVDVFSFFYFVEKIFINSFLIFFFENLNKKFK